jgi:deazaflavin-dependent oxidoreductase (nitroreductase family)
MATSEGKRSAERDLSVPARLALKLGSVAHAGLYRATGGKLFGRMGKSPILLLNTVGRKTGKKRTSPLLYVMDGEDFIIIASKGGAPTHPDWFHNVRANPQVTVEVGSETFPARATIAEGTERQRLFDQMAAQMPNFAEYQRNTTRKLPVIVLERAV